MVNVSLWRLNPSRVIHFINSTKNGEQDCSIVATMSLNVRSLIDRISLSILNVCCRHVRPFLLVLFSQVAVKHNQRIRSLLHSQFTCYLPHEDSIGSAHSSKCFDDLILENCIFRSSGRVVLSTIAVPLVGAHAALVYKCVMSLPVVVSLNTSTAIWISFPQNSWTSSISLFLTVLILHNSFC